MAEFADCILRSECIKVVFELKIPDILRKNDGFLSTKDICGYVKTECRKQINSGYLQRVMRYLARFGVFEEKYDGKVIVFQASNKLKEIDQYAMYQVDIYSNVAPHLMSALDGRVVDKALVEYVYGMEAWAWLEDSPERQKQFQDNMLVVAKDLVPYIPIIADEIKNEGKHDGKIVDFGGGSGQIMQLLKQNLPSLKCVNFELSQLIAELKPNDDVELVPGNFFDVTTMPKCDIAFIRNILHDWGDEECLKLLVNIHKVLPDDGLLLCINYCLPAPGDPEETVPFVQSLDMELLMICDAKERTLPDYKVLYETAGFEIKKGVKLGPTSRPCSLIIASKVKV